jgi:hypothetical protein
MAERDALGPIGTGRSTRRRLDRGDGSRLSRKRYSVLPLVPPQMVTGGDVAPDQADQFIVLTGFLIPPLYP